VIDPKAEAYRQLYHQAVYYAVTIEKEKQMPRNRATPTVKQILNGLKKKREGAILHRAEQDKKVTVAVSNLVGLAEDSGIIFLETDAEIVRSLIIALFKGIKVSLGIANLCGSQVPPLELSENDLVASGTIGRFDEGSAQFKIEVRRSKQSNDFLVNYYSC